MGSEPTVHMCKMLVPEVLSHSNYRIWSSCMKEYLLGQGLWDVTEAAEEEKPRSEYNSPEDMKTWRRKDAKALHAIKMSCGKKFISKIMKAESASEAWDTLRSIYNEDRLEEDTAFDTSYDRFIRATTEGDWSSMELFMKEKPEALTKPIFDGAGRTALHRVLKIGHEEVAIRLVKRMKAEDLAIRDSEGVTALSYGVSKNCPGMIGLAKVMVGENSGLPNIGKGKSFPVVKASWKGFKELTHYLYGKTDSRILDPQFDRPEGAQLLINCITSKMFDIASDLVKKFPSLVCEQAWDMSPAYALAKTYSPVPSASGQSSRWSHKWLSKLEKKLDLLCLLGIKKEYNDKEPIDGGALEFLKLVCEKISNFNNKQLREANVYGAMLKAAEIGNIDFILEMHKANSTLIWNAIDEDGKSIFWHAIANRQHKVYNLIYGIISSKESLLSCYKKKQTHNVLHLAAMLAPSHTLDQISGAALQMQRELQWFEEVKSIGKPRYKEDLNEEKLTPRQLFTRSHKELLVKGESELKETAKDSIIVGALIVTIMFTVAFPDDGRNQNGLPKIFIICDALSLFSSTTSVVVFLGLLISRYAEDDFLVRLPRKLMIGLCTLFFSIINMMIVFCSAVAIMLDGKSLFIIPVVLLACVPIILFSRVIVPQLCEIYEFTSGSIFDKNTRLPVPSKKQEGKSNTMIPDQV